MKIEVYGQDAFSYNTIYNDDNVENRVDQFFICLNSSGSKYAIPHFKREHFNVINTYFDDTEVDKFKVSGDITYFAKACTAEQAKQIKDFIDTMPEYATVHIYCAKGLSRSPAVRKFIEDYKNLEKTDYEGYNKYIYELLWQQV